MSSDFFEKELRKLNVTQLQLWMGLTPLKNIDSGLIQTLQGEINLSSRQLQTNVS